MMEQEFNKVSVKQIEQQLFDALHPSELKVIDDSIKHVGHSHADNGHFSIMITSIAFKNKSRLEIHRMIYKILEPFMNKGIHALKIHAKS